MGKCLSVVGPVIARRLVLLQGITEFVANSITDVDKFENWKSLRS